MIAARMLVAGDAEGPVVTLGEPLSFWGGFDSATGRVVDRRHPELGRVLTGAVVDRLDALETAGRLRLDASGWIRRV